MRWNETEEKLALESQIFRDVQLFLNSSTLVFS